MEKKEVQNSNHAKEETVVRIPLAELHAFKVRDDEAMTETAESVSEYSTPSVRPPSGIIRRGDHPLERRVVREMKMEYICTKMNIL